ncbi:unnamed protein product [Trifolium pratense]|uniref:Uncharacterized protein n=1 Tax=Trifolium pratense TaxID=57577 RepID=A0ACB0IS52_TRIPR|nr:unnamed protein product [Trifolium pratense]
MASSILLTPSHQQFPFQNSPPHQTFQVFYHHLPCTNQIICFNFSPTSPVTTPHQTKLPIRKIPRNYDIPFTAPYKEHYDYFYNQNPKISINNFPNKRSSRWFHCSESKHHRFVRRTRRMKKIGCSRFLFSVT